MIVTQVNNSGTAMPRKYILKVLHFIEKKFGKKFGKKLKYKKIFIQKRQLTVVFLNKNAARKINKAFRKKDYATDILSFQGAPEDKQFGELVLCPDVLTKQAKENGHDFKTELSYLLIHGVLHLLGYEHEGTTASNKKKARQMFTLQDQLFDSWLKK